MKKRTEASAGVKDPSKQTKRDSIFDVFEKRFERGLDDDHAACEKRKARNLAVIQDLASQAFKRWQLKLHEAGAEYVGADGYNELTYPDASVPKSKAWVLCIGPAFGSGSTLLLFGAGCVVAGLDPAKHGAWDLAGYRHQLACARPVAVYAERPELLWPGRLADGHRDCALLLAAGVRFDIYHRSMPHPSHRELIGEWMCGDNGRYGDYGAIKSAAFSALDNSELGAGIAVVTTRMLNGLKRRTAERSAKLSEQITALELQRASLDKQTAAVPEVCFF